MPETEHIRLTQFSKGSGCGCKIAPDVLEKILFASEGKKHFEKLLVGNDTRDDAAVYDLGDGKALISTVDFFTPIVDDAFDFGRIASANALSDIYAMGGKPILANAILGWPVDQLPAELAARVIEGANEICHLAGIPIAGGHSINSPEPIFGLAVNGLVKTSGVKKNSGAQNGDLLYLTKKLGSGILSSALKRGQISDSHKKALIEQLVTLNSIGEKIGGLDYVHAMTDITGFGFLGHLIEMAEGSGLSAGIDYGNVPVLEGVSDYTSKMIVPDNLYRNWNSYEKKVKNIGSESFFTLSDPQTNGGLMIAIDPKHQTEFENFLKENQLSEFAGTIGKMINKEEASVILN